MPQTPQPKPWAPPTPPGTTVLGRAHGFHCMLHLRVSPKCWKAKEGGYQPILLAFWGSILQVHALKSPEFPGDQSPRWPPRYRCSILLVPLPHPLLLPPRIAFQINQIPVSGPASEDRPLPQLPGDHLLSGLLSLTVIPRDSVQTGGCTGASEPAIWGDRHLLLVVVQQADWACS